MKSQSYMQVYVSQTALDIERSDDGLLTKPKLVTWKTSICVVKECVFIITSTINAILGNNYTKYIYIYM
jgi:hypothetical protein